MGPFEKGGRRFDYPGKQEFVFFDKNTGEIIGVFETTTLFDEDKYWNEFKPKGRGLWTPYNYEGAWRDATEEEQAFAKGCYALLSQGR